LTRCNKKRKCQRGECLDIHVLGPGRHDIAEEIQGLGPSHIHQNEVEDLVEEDPTADHQCQQEEDTLEAGKNQRKALVSEYLVSVCIQLSVNWTKSFLNLVHCKRSKLLDGKTGRSRGFAFVYFESLDDARAAKDAMCDTEIDGRRIRVDYSITKRSHTPTPGVYMGRPTYSRGGGGHRGGGGGYDRRDHGGYRGSGGHDRYRRSPSPYHRRDDYRRRSRSRSYSPRGRQDSYYY